jgi:hypothetical protein
MEARRLPMHLPVPLDRDGVKTFLDTGGVLMVYRSGCPYCEQLYNPSSHEDSSSVMSQLAVKVHGQGGLGHVCVIDAAEIEHDPPAALRGKLSPYPSIILSKGQGHATRYDGKPTERTVQDLYREISSLRGDVLSAKQGETNVGVDATSTLTQNTDFPQRNMFNSVSNEVPFTRPSPWFDAETQDVLTLRSAIESYYTDYSAIASVPIAIDFLQRNDSVCLVLTDESLKNGTDNTEMKAQLDKSKPIKDESWSKILMRYETMQPALSNAASASLTDGKNFAIVSRAGGETCIATEITKDAIDQCYDKLVPQSST